MAIKKTDYLKFGDDLFEIVPPMPTDSDRGGIIASPKESTDTVEIKLGDDGKLYAPAYPDLTNVDTSELQAQIDEIANSKADKEHTHDTYETKEGAQLKYDELMANKADSEHTHSWNDLEDKPFSDTQLINNLTWDGDTTNLIEIVENDSTSLFKVSDTVPSVEQLIGATLTTYSTYGDESLTLAENNISIDDATGKIMADFAVVIPYEFIDANGVTIKKGTYFRKVSKLDGKMVIYAKALSCLENIFTIETIKTLDDKYISSSIARTSYVDENFVRKSDIPNIDVNSYETKAGAQEKYDELATQLNDKADKEHIHDLYETKEDAQTKFNNVKSYVDNTAATQTALQEEIDRAKAAEKANADAITLLTNGVDQDKVDSVKDLIDYVEAHGSEVTGMKEDIADNAQAIKDEASRADTEEKRLAGLIGTNAENIQKNTQAIAALSGADGKVTAAEKADVASGLDEAGLNQVKDVVVNKAADADKLGGADATDYLKKAEAPGYDDILTKTNAVNLYQPKGEYATAAQGAKADTAVQPAALNNYYTKSEADLAFMDSTETGNAIDAKITALNLGATYEPVGAETRAKAYADSLAGNYATAAQGAKADTALQEITTTANGGLKVTNKNHIDIDPDVVFVFQCGSASVLVD